MNKDTDNLTWRDHFWPIAFALLAISGLAAHVWTQPDGLLDPARSRYHDASLDLETQPITTTQAYYEQEKAGLHAMEHSDLETTAEKLDRIRRRDESARLTAAP